MSKNKQVGGCDIEATASELLRKLVQEISELLKNEVLRATTTTNDIIDIVNNIDNPTSHGQ